MWGNRSIQFHRVKVRLLSWPHVSRSNRVTIISSFKPQGNIMAPQVHRFPSTHCFLWEKCKENSQHLDKDFTLCFDLHLYLFLASSQLLYGWEEIQCTGNIWVKKYLVRDREEAEPKWQRKGRDSPELSPKSPHGPLNNSLKHILEQPNSQKDMVK